MCFVTKKFEDNPNPSATESVALLTDAAVPNHEVLGGRSGC